MVDGPVRLVGHPPAGVAERLEQLRVLFVPESDAEALQRLITQPPARAEPFAISVGRRLDQLRALCDLANYLHTSAERASRG